MPVSLSNISWHPAVLKKLPLSKGFLLALVIIMILYIIKEPVSIPLIKIPFAFAIIAACFFLPKPLYHPLFWAAWLVYYFLLLVKDYYGVANHHFVTCYLLIAIIQYTSSAQHNDQLLLFHIRFILMAVLVLSAVHKLLSPQFTNGTFFQFEMYTDIFLRPMKWIIPGWQSAIVENQAAFKQFKLYHPDNLETIQLTEPIRYSSSIAKAGSLMSIIIEAAAGIAIYYKGQNRISHLLLLATVAGVLFFRLESGFLAIISCMAFTLAPSKGWKNTWLFCFIILAAMVATGAGLR